VDLDNRLSKARNNWSAGKPFKLIYVGSLLPYSQLDSLVDIARVVHELKREGWDIQLEIFSPWYRPYLNKFEVFDSVAMMPALEEGSMFERLVDSDLLLSPANFDKYSRNFIRFSFPAKIPLYMLSGSPILIYGPQTVSYIGDAMGKGWAYVVTDRVKEVLKKAIMELVRDSELRESLGREAQQLSVRLHDNEKMRQSFLKMMSGIVS
jgi:glycosyltransferase involved in cell wall biosynthesis